MKSKLFFLVVCFMSFGYVNAQTASSENLSIEKPLEMPLEVTKEASSEDGSREDLQKQYQTDKALTNQTNAKAQKLNALQNVREADSRAAKVKRDAISNAVANRLADSAEKKLKKKNNAKAKTDLVNKRAARSAELKAKAKKNQSTAAELLEKKAKQNQ